MIHLIVSQHLKCQFSLTFEASSTYTRKVITVRNAVQISHMWNDQYLNISQAECRVEWQKSAYAPNCIPEDDNNSQ